MHLALEFARETNGIWLAVFVNSVNFSGRMGLQGGVGPCPLGKQGVVF
jgi:hypothetical protein